MANIVDGDMKEYVCVFVSYIYRVYRQKNPESVVFVTQWFSLSLRKLSSGSKYRCGSDGLTVLLGRFTSSSEYRTYKTVLA